MSEQFDSMMEGLTELLEYVKGDKTKGRSKIIEIKNLPDKTLKTNNEVELENFSLKNNVSPAGR